MPRRIILVVCVLAQILASGVATRALAVQASGVISGRVETVGAGDRAPVRRAKVTLIREGSTDSATTSTDGEARFRFRGLVPGRYAVAVEKPGFVSNISLPIEVTNSERTVDVASDQLQSADQASLLALLRSTGVSFTVSERANTVVTLTLPR